MRSSFFFTGASRAIVVPLASAMLMLGAAASAPMTAAEAADRYATALSRMVEAAERVHDGPSARVAMRAFVDGTRVRLATENAVEAMSPSQQTAYERLIARRRGTLDAQLARFNAALARMMANPVTLQALADTGRARAM